MKTILFLSSLILSGCSCCGSDTVQYAELPPIVKVTERYIPIPEILIDGAELPIVKEDNLYTFSGEATDSSTGKRVELSGIIDTVSKKIFYSVRVPKDSVKTSDTVKTITKVPVIPDKPLAWWEKIPRYVIAIIVSLITLLLIWAMVRK
jgi:hypothetical protein